MASVFSEAGGWFYFWASPFVKVEFLDKVTGLWAFEGHLAYQKFQLLTTVVPWWLESMLVVKKYFQYF